MYLKAVLFLVLLLILQTAGSRVVAQTTGSRVCVLNADGELDCSDQRTEEEAAELTAAPGEPRSLNSTGEATRIFAHPGQYPPHEFGAYAIVAFKSGADASDRDRYHMICRAYLSAVPDSSVSTLPQENQLVTVWPLRNQEGTEAVAATETGRETCEAAVEHYGHTAALGAIRDARSVSSEMHEHVVRNRGPFLFAWNPGHTKGEADALILRMDLSDVDQPIQAKRRFEFWVQEIEENPQLWLDGWQKLPIRNRIAETADRYGQIILDFLGG